MSKIVSFQTIQFSISTLFKCKCTVCQKTFLFQAIQFSLTVLIKKNTVLLLKTFRPKAIQPSQTVQTQTRLLSTSMQLSSTQPIDRVPTGASILVKI